MPCGRLRPARQTRTDAPHRDSRSLPATARVRSILFQSATERRTCMAFATRLVAIERSLGKYSVHSQFEGGIPLDKLGPRERLSDLSTDPEYRDFAGVFTRAE